MKESILYKLNSTLIVVGILTAISSILLECLKGRNFLHIEFEACVWIHIGVSLLCMIAVIFHLYVHWGSLGQWFKRSVHLHAKLTKWLTWLSLITFLSGIVAAVLFLKGYGHTSIGGLHGKFGLAAILFGLLHGCKRFGWFKRRKEGKAFYPAVDGAKCSKCMQCVKRCPAQVFSIVNEKVVASQAIFCLQCMKCVRHCPAKAIKKRTVSVRTVVGSSSE